MSAMHAGVMTTSTEMMYAQLVTLTYHHIFQAVSKCSASRQERNSRSKLPIALYVDKCSGAKMEQHSRMQCAK